MDNIKSSLKYNTRILKSSVNKHAVYGLVISSIAILVATLVNCYSVTGSLSLDGIYFVQKTQPVLWLLDAFPFIFLFWGQYVGSLMAYEASALIMDQTDDLRSQTAALEKQVMHEATHDSLTQLPNRVLLHDRLEQAINNAVRQKHSIGLLIIDLDRFKEVNDTLGHFSGDRLLKQVALRLSGIVRSTDTLARMGGDEFAILLPLIDDIGDIEVFLGRITKGLHPPFSIEGMSLAIQASIGITICPEHGNDVDTLIQRAEVAMYTAKKQKNGHAYYSQGMDRFSPRRLTLMGELRQALQEEKLLLHFQPKIDLKSGNVNKAEALVRWLHPEHGLLYPNEFINLAERTGLIKDVTRWVLNESLKQILLWQQSGLTLELAVNLSPFCLLNPEFPEIITGILGSQKLSGSNLTIEITETSIIQDPSQAYNVLIRLKELGVNVSIDDFGTGYSSMAHLRKLPVSELKIDRSFVEDMLKNEDDEIIVKSIIDLAHNLGLTVVAEGVETAETALRLRELNCDQLQGFYFSKGLTSEQIGAWIASFPNHEWKNYSLKAGEVLSD